MRVGLLTARAVGAAAGWVRAMRGDAVVETKQYGICSFVYRALTPFHPTRFREFLDEFTACLDLDEEIEEEDAMDTDDAAENAMDLPLEARAAETAAKLDVALRKFGHVFRSKGFVWLAGRDDACGEYGHVGAVARFGCGGPWGGSLPKQMWPEEGSEAREMFERDFSGPVLLDRRQELVFIGRHMNKTAIVRALERCLVTRAEASRAAAVTYACCAAELSVAAAAASASASSSASVWLETSSLALSAAACDCGSGKGSCPCDTGACAASGSSSVGKSSSSNNPFPPVKTKLSF